MNNIKKNQNALGHKVSEEARHKMSIGHLGRTVSIETRRKISDALKGNTPWNKGKRGLQTSNTTSFKKGDPRLLGIKHWNWKGGITTLNKKVRDSFEYKQWRQAVFERDNYTCQHCGIRGGILNADHLKPFALFIRLRLNLDNGRTLCIDCHKKTDTYLKNISKKFQPNNIMLEQ